MTILRTTIVAVSVLAVVAVMSVGTSAALDQPSRTWITETIIDAPRDDVWRLVADFERYPDWNPYMSVEGRLAPRGEIRVRLGPQEARSRGVDARITVLKPPRKLRWQSRTVAPGLRDLEYEVVVAPLGKAQTLLVQRVREEGLLVMVTRSDSMLTRLEGMALALGRRAEATG